MTFGVPGGSANIYCLAFGLTSTTNDLLEPMA